MADRSTTAVAGAEARRERRPAPARRHPPWLKVRAPGGPGFVETRGDREGARPPHGVRGGALPEHRRSAGGTARRRSCCSATPAPGTAASAPCAMGGRSPSTPDEPARVAEAVARLGLRHVVVTSVNRDDLDGWWRRRTSRPRPARSRRWFRRRRVEVLVPDFQGDARRRPHRRRVADRHPEPQHRDGAAAVQARTARGATTSDRSPSSPRRARSATELPHEGRADARPRRGRPTEILTGIRRFTRRRLRHPDARPVPPAVRGASADRALRHARGVRGAERARHVDVGFRHVESGPLVRSSYHAWAHVP